MQVVTRDPLHPLWSRVYVGLWALWACFAVYAGVFGTPGLRPIWWALMGTFALLEGVGGIARSDRMPMLTECFGRFVPGWLTFVVLALAVWRLSNWVPGFILFPGAAWQCWHFIATYHAWQKLGSP